MDYNYFDLNAIDGPMHAADVLYEVVFLSVMYLCCVPETQIEELNGT